MAKGRAKRSAQVNAVLKSRKLSTQFRGATKGGKGGGFVSERWRPPKQSEGEEPQRILLYQGEYGIPIDVGGGEVDALERPFYMAIEHFNGSIRKGATCSAGLKLSRNGVDIEAGDLPCNGCYANIEKPKLNINRRWIYVFNGVLVGGFHLTQIEGRDGKPRKEWVACEGKRFCEECRNEVKRAYGRRVYWPMGTRALQQLEALRKTELRRHCKCGGDLDPVAFSCAACDYPLFTIEERRMTRKQINIATETPIECPHCGVDLEPELVMECHSCTDPQPLELWDVILTVLTIGEGTDSALKIQSWEPVSDKILRKLKKRMEPFDFLKIYRGPSLEKQADRLKIPNFLGKRARRRDEDEYEEYEEERVNYEDDERVERKRARKRRNKWDDDED